MEERNKILLLQIIQGKSDINRLRYQNMSFRQITELIEQNINEGYLDNSQDKIQITVLGAEYLRQNEHLIKERDKSKWIELDHKNKIKKIQKDDVFLPAQNALSFLK